MTSTEPARRRAVFALLVLARDLDAAAARTTEPTERVRRQRHAEQTRLLAGAIASGDASLGTAREYVSQVSKRETA